MRLLIGFASLLILTACSNKNTTDMEKKGECPFGFDKSKSTGQVIKGEGTTNKDWWPNQLDLGVLRQNSLMSNPMGATFDYKKEFNSIDYKGLKSDIKKAGDNHSEQMVNLEKKILLSQEKKYEEVTRHINSNFDLHGDRIAKMEADNALLQTLFT